MVGVKGIVDRVRSFVQMCPPLWGLLEIEDAHPPRVVQKGYACKGTSLIRGNLRTLAFSFSEFMKNMNHQPRFEIIVGLTAVIALAAPPPSIVLATPPPPSLPDQFSASRLRCPGCPSLPLTLTTPTPLTLRISTRPR